MLYTSKTKEMWRCALDTLKLATQPCSALPPWVVITTMINDDILPNNTAIGAEFCWVEDASHQTQWRNFRFASMSVTDDFGTSVEVCESLNYAQDILLGIAM